MKGLNMRILHMAARAIPVVVFAASSALAAQATQPATQATAVPDAALKKIASLLAPIDRGVPAERMAAIWKERLPKVAELVAQAERDYGDAKNIHIVHLMSVRAAMTMDMLERTPASRQRIVDTCKRILASNDPPDVKVQADLLLVQIAVSSRSARQVAPDAGAKILAMVRRHENTTAAGMALVGGLRLAVKTRQDEVRDQLLKQMETRHLGDRGVRTHLRAIGREPDLGKPFEAALTRLDGTRLTLPGDLLGKVVVVDFWAASWKPCDATTGKLKRLYGKYKSRGLEVVGISLDEKKSDVERFVRTKRLTWIHTFAGKGPNEDPTATRYFVSQIPSIWVVGRDGKIISASDGPSGYDRLEWVIVKALRRTERSSGTSR